MNINFIFSVNVGDLINRASYILRSRSDFGRCPQSRLPPINVKHVKYQDYFNSVIFNWAREYLICPFIFTLNDFKFLQHRDFGN